MNDDLLFLSATEQAQLLKSKQISAVELLDAHLAQIERVNPTVNAIVTLAPDVARAAAESADAATMRGESLGVLHGLPVAHKDLTETAGIRTTHGSPLFRDHIPTENALVVERQQAAGAVTLGKTNTPEFGAGSQTFNPIFGATKNPYDTSKTCGGSSGGAAVALACGMTALADGSDMGGSLRNPASFNNVVGFRPSPGRVPTVPKRMGWAFLGVDGPMARTVEDIALYLQAMAGQDDRAPISIREDASLFAQPLERDFRDVRIAWSRDFGGEVPVDAEVSAVIDANQSVFADIGCSVEDVEPNFAGADQAFKVGRAFAFAASFGAWLDTPNCDQLKETVIWNTQTGLDLTAAQIAQAEIKRTELYQRIRTFMDTYEFMIFPVAQVPPFDISTEYITKINGVEMDSYIDWMRSCYYISIIGLPAISVPCGFTKSGLPIGLQIVGRHQQDFSVLQLAKSFQDATQWRKKRPSIV